MPAWRAKPRNDGKEVDTGTCLIEDLSDSAFLTPWPGDIKRARKAKQQATRHLLETKLQEQSNAITHLKKQLTW